jgi:hypothetical protein
MPPFSPHFHYAAIFAIAAVSLADAAISPPPPEFSPPLMPSFH